MKVAEIYNTGWHRMVCSECEMIVLARPGHLMVLNIGDAYAPHVFASVEAPMLATDFFPDLHPPT
jgi:hypothetical protein